MAVDPAGRFVSVEAMAEALEAWLRGDTLLRRWAARILIGTTIAVIISLITVLVGSIQWSTEQQDLDTKFRNSALYQGFGETELEQDHAQRAAVYLSAAYAEYGGNIPFWHRCLSSLRRQRESLFDVTTPPSILCDQLAEALANIPRIRGSMVGHTDAIISSCISPDGKKVVTASHDNTARIWDAHSGKPIAILHGHTQLVATAVFSPDGEKVVTSSHDNTARIWDANSGRLLEKLEKHKARVNTAFFSPDGKSIVTSSSDNTACIWDSTSEKPLITLIGHSAPLKTASFSLDSKLVVTASWDKTALVWDRESGRQLAAPMKHKSIVTTASFSPDGKKVVTASSNTAHICDCSSGKLLVTLSGHLDRLTSASFSPDGKKWLRQATIRPLASGIALKNNYM